jgi:hypothetical protein
LPVTTAKSAHVYVRAARSTSEKFREFRFQS